MVPFIRCRTGDFATYVGDHCDKCGREHVIIRDIESRSPSRDLVALYGSLISMTSLNVHDDTFEHVRQFQFFQSAPGRAVLRIVPAAGFSPEDEGRRRASLDRKLNVRLKILTELIDSIRLSPIGEGKCVDQKLEVEQPT